MAFATHEDVATRLLRTLTSEEEAAATAVIATVEELIADAVGRDTDWANELDPVPAALKELCVYKAIVAIANPSNLASISETLGAHSRSETYPRIADAGVFLTRAEQTYARKAVFGKLVISPRTTPPLAEDYCLELDDDICS